MLNRNFKFVFNTGIADYRSQVVVVTTETNVCFTQDEEV
jgi:hypothetical protein